MVVKVIMLVMIMMLKAMMMDEGENNEKKIDIVSLLLLTGLSSNEKFDFTFQEVRRGQWAPPRRKISAKTMMMMTMVMTIVMMMMILKLVNKCPAYLASLLGRENCPTVHHRGGILTFSSPFSNIL